MKSSSPPFQNRVSVEGFSKDGTACSDLNHVKIDLENWMGQLPEYLVNVPIIYLAIPVQILASEVPLDSCLTELLNFSYRGHLVQLKNSLGNASELSYKESKSVDKVKWSNLVQMVLIGSTIICSSHRCISSHNSFTYSISPSNSVSPDSPPLVQNLGKWCKPLTTRIIYNWSQGQKEDVVRQLHAGIRYFDVRLVVYEGDIVIAHGLYGGSIHGFLEEINVFLESHPKEVAILDFQHFYEFNPEHHERMAAMLNQIFGSKICRRQRRMKENTLRRFWEYRNQVLIIYRNQVTRFNDSFWPSGTWATPWPNKVKVRELIEYLNKGLSSRKDGMGYVSQGILTPSTKYVVLHVFGSLRHLAARTNKKVLSWLETKKNGAGGVNVVICDFIERYNFCERVILLNYKSCDDVQKHFNLTDDANQYQEGVKY